MLLSENIKKYRLAKGLTQEQLATALGVSAQAVSKWETSDTYPDGALLLPLAKQLEVSLDALFGNDEVTMSDISQRIIKLMSDSSLDEHFEIARDICWQIERGMFNCRMAIDTTYDENELKGLREDSYIFSDSGFTLVSNGSEPFFALFPEPSEGFGAFLKDRSRLQQIFSALSNEHTMNALLYLYRQGGEFIFEAELLSRDCDIPSEKLPTVIEELTELKLITQTKLCMNGAQKILYSSMPKTEYIALFLLAHSILYQGAYCLTAHWRNKPLIK